MAKKKGTASRSRERLARLKRGYPLSTGKTPKEAPKTSRAKRRPLIDPGKKSGKIMKDKADQRERLKGDA